MKNLFLSEWERLWSRQSIWLLLAFMPALSLITALLFLRSNQGMSPNRPDYATALNFPVLGLSEHLFITFNIILLLLAGYIITEEYQKGQLRLILLRSYSMSQIFVSKLAVMAVVLFLFLFVYFLSSALVGAVFFEKPSQSLLFISENIVSNRAMMFYSFYYYVIAYFTCLAMLGLLVFIGIICSSMNAVLGVGFTFIFFSIAIPQLLENSTAFGESSPVSALLAYSSVPKIQYTGISLFLSGWDYSYWIAGITLIYIIAFVTLSYLLFTRRSYFI
ncbi:ABC transporter permease [Alteribacillus sp. HJP-4]|uniref:ABC transporter permease n=1 Tax=Alteribacillus sp. HJP-4 TaxID=2775394 RepID=UPI0035CCEFB4